MHISRTQFYGASTLDGFLSTNDDRIDWLLQFGDVTSSYAGFIAQVGAMAMGASTYEWLIRNHVRPHSPERQPWPYAQPTWVFTHRTLPRIQGANIRFVEGDVRPVHAAMLQRAAGKNIWIVGGGDLVGQFWDLGLLDDLIVQITPVTIGAGKPLLPRTIDSPPLQLVSVQQYGPFAELRYEVQKSL
ncbi:MAG: dihydrofolate reductase family protein [Opitutaceae bacterium]|nr:dihydrofolate reductase family protein [Opitutaceae bacterium]